MNKNKESQSDSDDDGFFLKPIKRKVIKSSVTSNSKNSNTESTRSTISEIFQQEINKNQIEIKKNSENKTEININKDNKDIIYKNETNKNKEINPNINITNSYIKIDKKSIFTKMLKKDNESTEEILDSFKKTNTKINRLFIPLLDRVCPNCDGNAINISKYLSKEISKFQKITKDSVEKYLNYFFSFRYELLYSTDLFLSNKTIRYLGYILSYTYNKFHLYSINDIKLFNNLAKKTLDIHEDALIDFYNSINELGEEDNTEKNKKMHFWKKNRNKYLIPPEINFLVNRFMKIKTCEIELDFQGASLDLKDFNLIFLFLLNINNLFVNLDHIKINFINQKYQYEIYTSYFNDLLSSTKINKNIIKKNNIINPELIYDKKWNFIDKFNLYDCRNIRKIKYINEYNKKNLIYDEYNILYINFLKKEINEEQMLNSTIEKTKVVDKDNKLKKVNMNINNIKFDFSVIEGNKIKINKIIKGKNNYMDIIKNNENFINLLAIIVNTIGRLDSIKILDIIMNDSYNNEFIINCVSLYDIDTDSIDVNIHILDLLYDRLKNLQNLNIEINSLEQLTFYKMLNLIYKNKDLSTLNISFFSSDATYLLRPLLKLYNQIIGDSENLLKYNNIKIEETILNSLLPFFIENLSVLFAIIKKSQKIKSLGLNFDLPIILINQQNYIIPIVKFLLNICFLIEDENCRINRLTIFAPYIILDGRKLPGINETFSEFEINKGKNDLIELNLQIQFYKIFDIKNLLSTKLIILNLGDLDLVSFKYLSKYLISYKFSSESNLQILSIRLNNSVTSFTTELKFILRALFYIKISNLSELNLFTNIIIKTELNYHYLINILKDNWIPDYTITFNSKSNQIINKLTKEVSEISYFINKDNDNIFWYLKYIFNNRYKNYLNNFISIKNSMNNILKYLYQKKEVKLNHSLENKINNTKNN